MAGKNFLDDWMPSKTQRSGEATGDKKTEKPSKKQKNSPELEDLKCFKEKLEEVLKAANDSENITSKQINTTLLQSIAKRVNADPEVIREIANDEDAVATFNAINAKMTTDEAKRTVERVLYCMIIALYGNNPASVAPQKLELIVRAKGSEVWTLAINDPKKKEELAGMEADKRKEELDKIVNAFRMLGYECTTGVLNDDGDNYIPKMKDKDGKLVKTEKDNDGNWVPIKAKKSDKSDSKSDDD